jgi:glucose-6-phosphate isomerase, archaeal
MRNHTGGGESRSMKFDPCIGVIPVRQPAISADSSDFMALGAPCDRERRFDYDAVRKRNGRAWYPIVTQLGKIEWVPNPRYAKTSLEVRRPRDYRELGFVQGSSLYEQAARDLDRFAWVSKPALCEEVWKHFEP